MSVTTHNVVDTDLSSGWRRIVSMAAHPSSAPHGADVLETIASGLAAVSVPWELRTGEVPTERRYEQLLSTPTYDAWIICWPAGTSLDLHDHGGAAGAFEVVSGHLDEARVTDGCTTVRRLAAGDRSTFGPDDIHGVANVGSRLATSIHVYSPPLTTMDFYVAEHDAVTVVRHDPGGWS